MSDLLNVMMVPFQQGRIALLPRELVEYVLPYAPPLPSSYAHRALIGSLIYQNEKVPVLDLAVLYGGEETLLSEIDGNRRIVIVSCLQKNEEFSSYAILATKAPNMINVSAEELHDTDDEVPMFFHSKVSVAPQSGVQTFFILDLPSIEAEFFS